MAMDQRARFRIGFWILAGVFSLGLFFHPPAIATPLEELVAKARQEGALSATVPSSMPGKTKAKLTSAFEARFGLNNVSVTGVSETRNYPKAAMKTKTGAVPTYDTMEGSGKNNVQFVALGGVQKIAGWQSLLKELNSDVRSGRVQADQISPEPFSGYAFQWLFRIKALIYNPRLVSKEDLPQTHAELADPKHKGKWTQPPFAAHWDIGPLVFPDIPQKEWIELVRKAGENAGAVLYERAGVERIALGEFAFGPANTYYYHAMKAKDPTAPLEITYFKDYNPVTGSYYVVRKGARNPAAATLFTLWMGTPEAKAIWQPDTFGTQFAWGGSDLDKKVKQDIINSGAKLVGFFDSERGVEFLRWIGTPEGRSYRKAVSKAIRGKKWKKKK